MTDGYHANQYGHGIHGVGYRRCPNCGEPVQRKIARSKVAARKYTRCYNCAPTLWMRLKRWVPW